MASKAIFSITKPASVSLGFSLIPLFSLALVLALSAYPAKSQSGWLPEIPEQQRQSISDAAVQRLQATQRSRDSASATHPLGVQVLFIERREEKKRIGALLADVFLFDYHRVGALVDTVDVNTGELINSRNINSLHLPLNSAEANHATQLLRDNSTFFETLSIEYQQRFGEALTARHAIDMKVSVYVPDEHVIANSVCAVSRCALISVFTPDHYNFSVEPVVDLVSGAVLMGLMQ